MVAYIVGMITGCVCMVTALIYLMHMGHKDPTLAYVVTAIGAIVFLLSAILVAVSAVFRGRREAGPEEKPEPAPEQPAVSEPDTGEADLGGALASGDSGFALEGGADAESDEPDEDAGF